MYYSHDPLYNGHTFVHTIAMEYIPNIITCLRMVLSCALIVLYAQPWAFVAVYLLCGLTDVLDGWIARRYHLTSTLGAKLDSIADLLFFGVSLYAMYRLIQDSAAWPVLICFFIIVAIRAVNLVITRRRFAQWGILHTIGNKIAGLCLFASVPLCVYMGGYPVYVIVPLFLVALLSSVDETITLCTQREYNPDARGYSIDRLFPGK